MTLDEAIKHAEEEAKEQDKLCKRYDDASGYTRSHNEEIRTTNAKKCAECAADHRQLAEWLKDYKRLLEQQPCEDAVSRQAVFDAHEKVAELFPWRVPGKYDTYDSYNEAWNDAIGRAEMEIEGLQSVNPQPKTGHCKDCKYFEYDSVAKVDGIPLIVAHEICSRWGEGCKTTEEGYCFLYEPKMSEIPTD